MVQVTTTNRNNCNVLGIYDYSSSMDLALLQISGYNYSYLRLGDSKSILTGSTVYAIGNPLGLESTFSQGIISSSNRILYGQQYIQMTPPISMGSSGGALLNTKGEVIGVTTAQIDGGQNFNLAVPIDLILQLLRSSYSSLSSIETLDKDQ